MKKLFLILLSSAFISINAQTVVVNQPTDTKSQIDWESKRVSNSLAAITSLTSHPEIFNKLSDSDKEMALEDIREALQKVKKHEEKLLDIHRTLDRDEQRQILLRKK